MPDGNDKTELDEDEVPSTPLHAHESGIEETNARPREDLAEGEILDDDQDDAAEANTGGATSGGPPREDAGEDPSNV